MVRFTIVALVAAATLQQPVPQTAQATASAAIDKATTASECLLAARNFVGKRQQEVRPPTGYTSEILKQVDQEKAALVARCVARFEHPATDAGLAGLAELYSDAAQPELARTTLARALASKNVMAADRAAALVIAVHVVLKDPKGDERNALLETYVDALDKLAAASIDQKFDAHRSMLGYYRYDDLDGGIIKHATWMIDAAKTFTPEQRQTYGTNVVLAHVDMAEAWAGQGMNDQAIALLKRAKTDWAGTRNLNDYVDPEIARLELVGTPGAPLTAPRWLNLPGQTSLDMPGHVTLLEFSAHWCVPCKESYPGVNRLRAKYGSQGFRAVIATQLYGYFQTERGLTPDAEIDRDRTYFAEHGLDVPIAIGDRTTPSMVEGKMVMQRDANDDHYRVGGIPQIQLIDKHGRIRLMMVGYDDANEEKLAKMIESLLKEK